MPNESGNEEQRSAATPIETDEQRKKRAVEAAPPPAQGLMLMSPQVLAAQPNARRVRIGRENAVATYDPAQHTGQLMLDIGGRVSIMLEGRGIAGTEPLVELASRWDIRRVRELAGL